MLKILPLLILGVAVLLAACSPTVRVQENMRSSSVIVNPPTPKRVTVTERDSGHTIHLNTGDTLVVVLNSNSSTGYSWQLQPRKKGVLKRISTDQAASGGNLLGAGGETILRFRAERSGHTRLHLLYRRPFEQDTPPAREFEISVSVN